jgi:phosphoribosylformylglycinamidine cyclo-ligase
MSPTENYLKRGVSAKKEDVHQAITSLDQGLFSKLFCKVFPDVLGGSDDYVNLMSSDGSGTKSAIAYLYWLETGDASVFRGIGQDALVMNLDDMACVGAIDNFLFTSIINRNKHRIPGVIIKEIIDGTKEYIDTLSEQGIQVTYTGGETADVGDIVRTISVDASMVARMKKSNIIQTNSIAPGQIIVGLASYGNCSYEKRYNSGMGSNGLTSARHDLLSSHYTQFDETIEKMVDPTVQYSGKNLLTDIVYDNWDLGQLILSPTMSFTPILKRVFDMVGREHIKSIVHCTGGGASKVLHFAEKVKIVKDNMLPIPFLFDFIQSQSQTSWQEMFQVFNMGTRLEIYIENEATAKEIIAISKSFGVDAQIIGYVESSEKAEVEVKHNQISYHYFA